MRRSGRGTEVTFNSLYLEHVTVHSLKSGQWKATNWLPSPVRIRYEHRFPVHLSCWCCVRGLFTRIKCKPCGFTCPRRACERVVFCYIKGSGVELNLRPVFKSRTSCLPVRFIVTLHDEQPITSYHTPHSPRCQRHPSSTLSFIFLIHLID